MSSYSAAMKQTVYMSRSASFLAFLALLVAGLTFGGCGDNDEEVQAEVQKQLKAERAREAQKELKAEQIRMKRELKKLKRKQKSSSSSSSGGSSASSLTSCGGGVSANSATTCSFAVNVAVKYRRNGDGVVNAYSPALDRYFTMNCSNGRCTGGNNALVVVR